MINIIKVSIISIGLIFCVLTLSFASPAAIFFSDLVSGPNYGGQDGKGAFVTIWGKNFGAIRGSSYITVGGQQVDNYPLWSDTKISFQLGQNTGTGQIIVVTPEGDSNGIDFTVRGGNIYFVKVTGSDASGDGSWNNPWRSIIKAKKSLQAGDIAYICDGVKQDTLDGYNACLNLDSSGTPYNPKALVAYPGATVNVGNPSLQRGFWYWRSGAGNTRWWVISQINITASDKAVPCGYGFRIVGNKITVPKGDGPSASIHGEGSYVRILGNELYNCGLPNAGKLYHNIYITNHTGNEISDIEIGWNIIRDSTANRGIQLYSDGKKAADISNVYIHDNLIFNLKGNAINISNHSAGKILICNNIIYNCGRGPDFRDGVSNYAGMLLGGNMARVYIYNNIIYDCGNPSRPENSGLLNIKGSFRGVLDIKNNIFYSNGKGYQPYIYPKGYQLPTGGYHNLFYGIGRAPSWDNAAVSANPQFVDLMKHDFHLKPTSPAKDKGTDEVRGIVTTDFDGILRPQGSGFDIGAYEFRQS